MAEMENLKDCFNKRLEQISVYEEAMKIIAKKAENLPTLECLEERKDSVKDIVNKVKDLITKHKAEDLKKYTLIMNKLRNQQLIMLNIIEKIEEKSVNIRPRTPTEDKKNFMTPMKDSSNMCRSMYINDFLQSPFIFKKKPVSLNFLDFNIKITQEEFEKLPKYMRGRESVDELNEFLDSVIIKCLNEKYALMYKQREVVLMSHRSIWNMYRSQEKYFPGKKFITQGDIAKIMNRLLDKKILNKFCMLRHLSVIKEATHDSTICYIWNYNCEN